MIRVLLTVLLLTSCSSRYEDLDGSAGGWPECPDGSVVHWSECVDPGGLSPCELIAASGGCAEGFHCDEGARGCVEGVPCGEAFCAPGELCVDGAQCTCGDDGECPAGQVCAPISRGEDGLTVAGCVPPDHDGDGDGHAVGDLDGDGRGDDCDDLDPAIGPMAPEVCDGRDNDCDVEVDEDFDLDADSYTTCGTEHYGPDCDDADPTVHPGGIDLCALGPDGTLIDTDCNPEGSSCPFGTVCCEGVEGCVVIATARENCGECGRACGELDYCVVGECQSTMGEFGPDPAEGAVPVAPDEEGRSNHPDVAWNWMRVNQWFSWSHDHSWYSYQFFFWELDYGIAWVQQVGDRGLLLFTGRHFVSSPIAPISQVAGAVSDFLSPLQNLTWYGTTLVDVLDSEDTIPCLAPSGGLGYGLAWSDGPGNSQIHFAALGPYGSLAGWNAQLTFDPADHLFPRLAWSPYFYYLGAGVGLVYQRQDGDEVQVYFQHVQSYWDWWVPFGIAWRVSNDEEGAFSPDIAWSPHGYGVVWQGAAENDLYFALVGHFGATIVPPQRITTDNNVAAWRPSICWNDADGEFGVAYQGTSPPASNQDIFFIRIAAYGRPLSARVQITSDPELQRHPDMAWTGDGYGLTWYDRRSGTNEIAFALLEPDGSLSDGPTMMTSHSGGGEAANPALTHASATDALGGMTFGLAGWAGGDLLGNGEFGLVWRDQASASADPRVHFMRMPRSE